VTAVLLAASSPSAGQVDPILAAATGAAIVAVALSIAVAIDALRDLREVIRLGIGDGRRRIARTEFQFEVARTTVAGLLLLVAWTATMNDRQPSTIGVLARLAFLSAFVVISLDGLAALRYRVWLRASYDSPSDHPKKG
jgi:hypothetical protein